MENAIVGAKTAIHVAGKADVAKFEANNAVLVGTLPPWTQARCRSGRIRLPGQSEIDGWEALRVVFERIPESR